MTAAHQPREGAAEARRVWTGTRALSSVREQGLEASRGVRVLEDGTEGRKMKR